MTFQDCFEKTESAKKKEKEQSENRGHPRRRDVEVEIKMEYSDGFSILETQVKSGLKLPTDLDYL